MINKNMLHLVPQILQDRAASMLREKNLTASENIAQQLEVVAEFCNEAIKAYQKNKLLQTQTQHIKKKTNTHS